MDLVSKMTGLISSAIIFWGTASDQRLALCFWQSTTLSSAWYCGTWMDTIILKIIRLSKAVWNAYIVNSQADEMLREKRKQYRLRFSVSPFSFISKPFDNSISGTILFPQHEPLSRLAQFITRHVCMWNSARSGWALLVLQECVRMVLFAYVYSSVCAIYLGTCSFGFSIRGDEIGCGGYRVFPTLHAVVFQVFLNSVNPQP